jgi:hypothetical protein
MWALGMTIGVESDSPRGGALPTTDDVECPRSATGTEKRKYSKKPPDGFPAAYVDPEHLFVVGASFTVVSDRAPGEVPKAFEDVPVSHGN